MISAFLPKADIVLIQGVFVYFAVLHDEEQGLGVLVASGGIKPFGAGRSASAKLTFGAAVPRSPP